jgi:pimeloyl-ACP methyl ester carboxylesterase
MMRPRGDDLTGHDGADAQLVEQLGGEPTDQPVELDLEFRGLPLAGQRPARGGPHRQYGESVVQANHWHFFRHFLHDARPEYTPEEMDRYIEAWSQPGAATGMINYYRSSVRTPPKRAEAALVPIKAPTLVIWGQDDGYLGSELAEPDHDDVPNLDRVERLLGASHWVHHDAAERVTELLIDFFTASKPAENRAADAQ